MKQQIWPVVGTEAIAAGVATKRTLHSRYTLVHRNVYLPPGGKLTPQTRAVAAYLFSGRRATLAGLSAAAAHGTEWIDAGLPAELYRAEAGSNGIVIHRGALADEDVCVVRGMPATTPARTAFDLGRRKGYREAVIRLDALAAATGVTPAEIAPLMESHSGARGIVQLRRAVEVMDGGAESPQETRTRLVLLDGGLPRPQTQIVVYDQGGYPYARIDMGYPDVKVGVEYDGPQHWTDPKRRRHDIERRIELSEDGWIIVHVTADMLRERPWLVVQRVVEALRRAGCPWLAECELNPRVSLLGVD